MRVKVERPVFIVGCGRSGTTLLFQLLRRHPELQPTTGYPDGEDHVGWNAHGRCYISGLGHPDKDLGHTGYCYCLYMDENDADEEVVQSMHRYYAEAVLKGRQGLRVLNKCPHLSNKLRYVRAIFPDARFVHIVRDCPPVVRSWERIMEEQPGVVLYWPETDYPCFWVLPAELTAPRERVFRNERRMYPGGGSGVLASYWAETNRNIPRQLADAPDALLTVRYEDLCARPAEVLDHIRTFCDLAPFAFPLEDDYGRPVADRGIADAATVISDPDEGIRARVSLVREQFGYA